MKLHRKQRKFAQSTFIQKSISKVLMKLSTGERRCINEPTPSTTTSVGTSIQTTPKPPGI